MDQQRTTMGPDGLDRAEVLPGPPASRRLTSLASLLILVRTLVLAADCDPTQPPFRDKEFVVVRSTPSFDEATKTAAEAAAGLGIKLNRRGLSPNLRTGLTFSREECARRQFPYPCYVPRGRGDNGTYASVEWSSEYERFDRALYVVMIASHELGSRETRRALEAARRIYPAAYSKRVKVYVGCQQ